MVSRMTQLTAVPTISEPMVAYEVSDSEPGSMPLSAPATAPSTT